MSNQLNNKQNNSLNLQSLEEAICGQEYFKKLESSFDNYFHYPSLKKTPRTQNFLRLAKLYLMRNVDERNDIFKDTLLRGSDCLTLTVLAWDLAKRKGYNVEIISSTELSHYLHTAILYEENSLKKIFKVAGRSPIKSYKILNEEGIVKRLNYIKPAVDFINRHIRKKY